MSGSIPHDGYAIIIGAMKCGTSSLYSYMAQHPAICPAVRKEPEFFSRNLSHGVNTDRYEDLWSFDPTVHLYALEASTGYTKYPYEEGVPRRMFEYGIRPKLIYIVRNPFKRIESHFNYMSQSNSWNKSIDDDHLIYTSNYYVQLEEYRKYFSIDDMLILDFEELNKNTDELMNSVYTFLQIPCGLFPRTYEIKNATKTESSIEKYLRNGELDKAISWLPKPVKRFGKSFLSKIDSGKGRQLSKKRKEMIYRKLKDDMFRFKSVYNFNVDKWGFD